MAQQENFRQKYTHGGCIGGMLVDHFYRSFGELVQLSLPGPGRVLEVGVGEGFSTERIVKMLPSGSHFEASEYRSDLVQLAQQRNPGLSITRESVYTLNRGAASFDLVICLEVLEHLDDPGAALAELRRVTARHAIVSVPREPIWRLLNLMRGKYLSAFGNTPGHIQHWSTRSFHAFVAAYFDVQEVRRPLPWTILLLKKKT